MSRVREIWRCDKYNSGWRKRNTVEQGEVRETVEYERGDSHVQGPPPSKVSTYNGYYGGSIERGSQGGGLFFLTNKLQLS